MGLEAIVGMRCNRKTQEGKTLLELKGQGRRVYLQGLCFPLGAIRYRYPPHPALVGEAALYHRALLQGHEEQVLPGAVRSAGVHRFLVLSLLAYLLAHWVRLGREGLTWRDVAR